MVNVPLARQKYLKHLERNSNQKEKKRLLEFSNYLNGKNIVIVGPAGYLEGKGRGEWIDSFDVVVRMNLALPVQHPKDYGTRADILYTFATRLWAEHWVDCSHLKGLSWVVITTGKEPYISRFRGALPKGVQMRKMTKEFYRSMNKAVICTSNTGTTAISDLLTFGVKSITVVGFDYYASGYHSGYGGDGDPGNHVFRNQLAYMSILVNQENRLIFDEALKSAITNALTIQDEEVCTKEFSLLIPYVKTDDHRHRTYSWLMRRYQEMFPNAEVCIGESKPFNRAKAINNAASKATKDIFIITDADALFTVELVDKAFDAFRENCVKVKNVVCDIEKESTKELLASDGVDACLIINRIRPANFFMLISRKQFEDVGGFDEGFTEWGGEDNAFLKVLRLTYGEFDYCTGGIYHLWHPESEGSKSFKQSSAYKRWQKYVKAKTLRDIKRI